MGLGVRKVSFLRVKVYSAGFYVEESALGRLGTFPGWKAFTAASLINPKSGDALIQGEDLMASLLDQGVACAIRIGKPHCNTTDHSAHP